MERKPSLKKECFEELSHPIIVCEEEGRQARFINKSRSIVLKIIVDGCEIDDNGRKCDFLVVSEKDENFVELKGASGFNHAISQLKRSIDILSKDAKTYPKRAILVMRECPSLDPRIQRLKAGLRRQNNCELIMGSGKVEIKI